MPCARNVAVTWSYQTGASERGNPVQSRPGQPVQPDASRVGELVGVGGRHDDPQGFFNREDRVVARIGRALTDEGEVKPTRLELGPLAGTGRVADLHPGQWERGAQFRQHPRQKFGRQLQRDAQLEAAGAGSVAGGDGCERPLVLGDERAALAQQDRPGLGGGDPGAAAQQQLHAQLAFQRLDGLRQRGLAQVQPTSGRGQAAFFGHGREGPDLAYFHASIAYHSRPERERLIWPPAALPTTARLRRVA